MSTRPVCRLVGLRSVVGAMSLASSHARSTAASRASRRASQASRSCGKRPSASSNDLIGAKPASACCSSSRAQPSSSPVTKVTIQPCTVSCGSGSIVTRRPETRPSASSCSEKAWSSLQPSISSMTSPVCVSRQALGPDGGTHERPFQAVPVERAPAVWRRGRPGRSLLGWGLEAARWRRRSSRLHPGGTVVSGGPAAARPAASRRGTSGGVTGGVAGGVAGGTSAATRSAGRRGRLRRRRRRRGRATAARRCGQRAPRPSPERPCRSGPPRARPRSGRRTRPGPRPPRRGRAPPSRPRSPPGLRRAGQREASSSAMRARERLDARRQRGGDPGPGRRQLVLLRARALRGGLGDPLRQRLGDAQGVRVLAGREQAARGVGVGRDPGEVRGRVALELGPGGRERLIGLGERRPRRTLVACGRPRTTPRTIGEHDRELVPRTRITVPRSYSVTRRRSRAPRDRARGARRAAPPRPRA